MRGVDVICRQPCCVVCMSTGKASLSMLRESLLINTQQDQTTPAGCVCIWVAMTNCRAQNRCQCMRWDNSVRDVFLEFSLLAWTLPPLFCLYHMMTLNFSVVDSTRFLEAKCVALRILISFLSESGCVGGPVGVKHKTSFGPHSLASISGRVALSVSEVSGCVSGPCADEDRQSISSYTIRTWVSRLIVC